ncbi:MAG: extradiol dioxygenase [Candidatus Asgardarchaeia archaeon]
MGVVFAGIAPHGDEIIPEINPNMDEKTSKLSNAMEKFANLLFRAEPETIVIATPHNLRLYKHIGVIGTVYTEGYLTSDNKKLFLRWACDRSFSKDIYALAEISQLPVILANYGTDEGELSSMCMDWGTFVPLWFIKKRYELEKKEVPKVVVVTPSREIPNELLVKFGMLIAEESEMVEKQIAFIASADQGHAHDPKGPYGYSKESEEYDTRGVRLVNENKLNELLKFSKDFIEKAKPDSYWQMLILLGVLKKSNLRLRFSLYECPTYFGMLVAAYT